MTLRFAPPMRAALALLLLGEAELGGDEARPVWRAPTGDVIALPIIKSLARRALGRPRGDVQRRFTLTAAGRRTAVALQTRTAS
jgi:hypothetical protein